MCSSESRETARVKITVENKSWEEMAALVPRDQLDGKGLSAVM